MRKATYVTLLIFGVLLSTYLVSAGIGDWFKGITGYDTYRDTNVTVSLSGTAAVTVLVYNATLIGTAVDPTEDQPLGISYTAELIDADGVADINTTSVGANITAPFGGQLRQNTTCTSIGGESTITSQNFSCNVTIYYFDVPGSWTINTWGQDLGNTTTIYNQSMVFDYDALQAITLSPASLTWPGISPGQQNQTASTYTTLNNTGNYNITNITMTAINLIGATYGNHLDVANFTIDITTGAGAECVVTSSVGVTLANNTQLEINSAELLRGNNSVDDGATGQERLYHCMPIIPQIITDSYSTTDSDEWRITLVP